eukprot:Phypoly_transcript_14040.p1 GENE.Phypoly_transcript_14040~~Phypoly_transcript_14040.p1  ORF type:complete len:242 (+),score=19.07 Phypoly_transcript_14040:146-871(+)
MEYLSQPFLTFFCISLFSFLFSFFFLQEAWERRRAEDRIIMQQQIAADDEINLPVDVEAQPPEEYETPKSDVTKSSEYRSKIVEQYSPVPFHLDDSEEELPQRRKTIERKCAHVSEATPRRTKSDQAGSITPETVEVFEGDFRVCSRKKCPMVVDQKRLRNLNSKLYTKFHSSDKYLCFSHRRCRAQLEETEWVQPEGTVIRCSSPICYTVLQAKHATSSAFCSKSCEKSCTKTGTKKSRK